MDEKTMQALLAALTQKADEPQTQQFVTVDAFNAAMAEIGNKLEAAIGALPEMVAKALPTQRQGESKITMGGADEMTLDSDPAHYIVKKSIELGGELTDPVEQRIAFEMFKAEYGRGLTGGE